MVINNNASTAKLLDSKSKELKLVIPEGKEAVIGSLSDCDLILEETGVSRRHASISKENKNFFLMDLDSTNGTYLNSKRLEPREKTFIQHGDLIQIGARILQFDYDSINSMKLNWENSPIVICGRGLNGKSDLSLDHPSVSRNHARIERKNDTHAIIDLESTNGTYVNANPLTPHKAYQLESGDLIQIGPYELLYQDGSFTIQNKIRQRDENNNKVVEFRLDAVNLNKVVGNQKTLLKEISLTFPPGKFIVIAGVSGGGKSTLLDALNGLRPATQGKVYINNIDLYQHFDLYRSQIGYVPQKDIIHSSLTVAQTLDYAARLRMLADTTHTERGDRIRDVLEDLELYEHRDTTVEKLSGGQLKRVSMGVELLTKPSLFFLDEATSGLDPGTEKEIMELLQKLAKDGHTIALITHATENVKLCDLVVFLAKGGRVAYFGPPAEAPQYFQVSTFNEIYRKVEFEKSADDWRDEYKQSPQHQQYIWEPQKELKPMGSRTQLRLRTTRRRSNSTSPWRQLEILTRRNFDLLRQDRPSLMLMLALAPALGLFDLLIWSRNLFHTDDGDPGQSLMALFVAAIVAILVGSLCSMREIVKEREIYKRERMVGLQLPPYVLSKVSIGVLVSLYQTTIFVLFKYLAIALPGGFLVFAGLYTALLLATVGGMVMGLLVSAIAPNQNVAPLLVILFIVPQITFGGGLVPIGELPITGQWVSNFTLSRWSFESMVKVTGMGEDIVEDKCFSELDSNERDNLSEEEKDKCDCLGANLFTNCEFPGIGDEYKPAVDDLEPEKPEFPQSINPEVMERYQDDLEVWQDEYSEWKEERGKAITTGESIINRFYDDYGKAFRAQVLQQWSILVGLIGTLLGLTILVQKQKD